MHEDKSGWFLINSSEQIIDNSRDEYLCLKNPQPFVIPKKNHTFAVRFEKQPLNTIQGNVLKPAGPMHFGANG